MQKVYGRNNSHALNLKQKLTIFGIILIKLPIKGMCGKIMFS